jgi:hypothetical protein
MRDPVADNSCYTRQLIMRLRLAYIRLEASDCPDSRTAYINARRTVKKVEQERVELPSHSFTSVALPVELLPRQIGLEKPRRIPPSAPRRNVINPRLGNPVNDVSMQPKRQSHAAYQR